VINTKDIKLIPYLLAVYFIQFWSWPVWSDEPIVRPYIQNKSDTQTTQWLWKTDSNNQPYPYVRMQSHQIAFLNSSSQIVSTHPILPGSGVVESPNQHFLGVVTMDSLGKGSAPDKYVSFHVSDESDNRISSIQQKLGYDDGILQILVKKDGYTIFLEASSQTLSFYAKDGRLSETVNLFANNIFDYEKPLNAVL